MRSLSPLFATALAVLLPLAAHGYINAGFRSQKEYDAYLEKRERIRNPRTAEDFILGAGHRWDTTGKLKDYSRAIELDPSNLDGYFGRGYYRWRCEDYAEALADFEEARRRAHQKWPRSSLPAQRLLVVYTFCPDEKIRNLTRAVEMAREISFGSNHIELLAETLARAGDFKGAAREQARFIDTLRQKNWEGPLLTQAEQRLEAYRRRQVPEPHANWKRLGLPIPDLEE